MMDQELNRAIEALTKGVPQFDAGSLSAERPTQQFEVGPWLAQALKGQQLISEIENGFFEWVPSLKPLKGIDFTEFEPFPDDVRELAKRVGEEGVNLFTDIDIPYLALLNASLCPHGLALIKMTEIRKDEDGSTWPYFYLMVLKNDAAEHAELTESLKPFGMHLHEIRPPLNRQEADEYMDKALIEARKTSGEKRAAEAELFQELFGDLEEKSTGILGMLKGLYKKGGLEL